MWPSPGSSQNSSLGLTTSLHYEAEELSIKVSALCPTFVETPIFEEAKAININKTVVMTKQLQKQKIMSPEKLAKITLRGIHRNKLIICQMLMRRTMSIFLHFSPQ